MPKITSVSNEAIDMMDAFAKDVIEGHVGGRRDYWDALQHIINAGVTFEVSTRPTDAMREALEWQPIETAPKGSRAIMVWCPANKCTYMVTWTTLTGWRDDYESWGLWGTRAPLGQEPTHWRPIPEPPAALNREA